MKTRRLTDEEYHKIYIEETGDLLCYLGLVRKIMLLPDGERLDKLDMLRIKIEMEQKEWLNNEEGDAPQCRWWFFVNGIPTDFDMKQFEYAMQSEDGVIPDMYEDLTKALRDAHREETITRTEWVMLLFYRALWTEIQREKDWGFLNGRVYVSPREPRWASSAKTKNFGDTDRAGFVISSKHGIRLERMEVERPIAIDEEKKAIAIDENLNSKFLEYEKLAENILKYKDLDRRIAALDGLLAMVRTESNGDIVEETSLRVNCDILVEETNEWVPVSGEPDYEMYKSVFNNPEQRQKIQSTAEEWIGRDGRHFSFSDVQRLWLYAAIKKERDRSEKERACQTPGANKGKKDLPNHFSVPNTEEKKRWLVRVLKKLINEEYLHSSVTESDWLYYCTGKGTIPDGKIQWLKDDDELGYFVKTFFKDSQRKYDRAEMCFLLKNGDTPNGKNLRTNATAKKDKTGPIDEIVHLK